MRPRTRRLTARDRLNIRVALTVQITQCIAKVKDATSQHMVEVWSHEAASYIITQHRMNVRGRKGDGLSEVSHQQVADLAAAVTAAITRLGQP